MLVKSYRPLPRFRWFGWILFIFLVLLIQGTVYRGIHVFSRPFKMPTSSMSPTIQGSTKRPDGTTVSGDRIFVEEYAYWFNKPQRGDIVVFETKGIPENQRELYRIPPDEFYIKRVVGIPGDVLSIQNGHLYNHGQILRQPPILAKLEFSTRPFTGQTYLVNSTNNYAVPDGSYFVIGDNTTNSLDSRFWGAIPEKDIIGRISKIYWPLNRAGKVQ
jgi:signal peptidase I